MINKIFYAALMIFIYTYPTIGKAKIEPSIFKLLNQIYGNYDNSRECWVVPSKDEPKYHYCMKITESNVINTESGKRLYLVLTGSLLDNLGEDAGSHVDTGNVGLFVIELKNSKILAAESSILVGTSGFSPEEWQLIKLAPSDYWGWMTSYSDCHQGHCGSRSLIFAPYGKTGITNLAVLVRSYEDAGAGGSTEITANISVDNLQVKRRIFPLKVSIEGIINGKKIKEKSWVLPFNIKKWEYIEPTEWPLSNIGF